MDLVNDTNHIAAFERWWDFARAEFLSLGGHTPPTQTTLYYDPLLDVHLRGPIAGIAANLLYLAPLVPEEARELFDAAAASIGLTPQSVSPFVFSNPRTAAPVLFLAKEWDMTDLAGAVDAQMTDAFQPTWDRRRGEFTWGCDLLEEHPRGQYNAWLAAAEAVTPGRGCG